jgi:CO/xanthine dehydrogenase Mo-binding subunit
VCSNAVSRSLNMRITELPMSPPRLLDAIEG